MNWWGEIEAERKKKREREGGKRVRIELATSGKVV